MGPGGGPSVTGGVPQLDNPHKRIFAKPEFEHNASFCFLSSIWSFLSIYIPVLVM